MSELVSDSADSHRADGLASCNTASSHLAHDVSPHTMVPRLGDVHPAPDCDGEIGEDDAEFFMGADCDADFHVDMDILVRKKPFREDNQGGFMNDVDSDDEATKERNPIYSEFLGGAGEDEQDDVEDIDGDLTVRCQALFQMSLDECKALLRKDNELQRASAPGRHKEAHRQMKGYVDALGGVLQLEPLEIPTHRQSHLAASLPLHAAADFQGAVAKEMRMQLQQQSREDALKGPGHVARKLMQDAKTNGRNSIKSKLMALFCAYGQWSRHGRSRKKT